MMMMEELSELKVLNRSNGVTLSEVLLIDKTFVTVLTIDRPHVRNALDVEAMKALSAYVSDMTPSLHRIAIILNGAGGSFISGGDLKALHDQRDQAHAQEMSQLMRNTLDELSALPCLLIMAAEGAIIGGGAEVFLAGDFRVMSDSAEIRFAQSALGLCTGWGGGRRLAQIVGPSKGLALMLEATPLSSTKCELLGIAHRIVPTGEVLTSTLLWLKDLSVVPEAVRELKKLFKDERFSEINTQEAHIFPRLWSGDEHWLAVDRMWSSKKGRSVATEVAVIDEQSNHQARGLFVVLEGIDGAGTTTQAERIVEWLQTRGRVAHLTQEPSTGVIGTLTRRSLRGEPIGHDQRLLPAESIALLFAADRADHWHNEIEPRLERGEDVICDRYLYSSLAYQGLELPESWVRSLNKLFPQPDLLLFVEVTPNIAAERRGKRGLTADRYEVDELQVQIAARYAKICNEYQAQTIDGDASFDEVTSACLQPLQTLIEMTSSSKESK